MKNLIGVVLIALFWLKTADFIREFTFELKFTCFIGMGVASLFIAFYTNLIDKIQCRK